MHCGDPIVPIEGEELEDFRLWVGKALRTEELEHGPETAQILKDGQITFI